jgi:hypothetical protein
LGAIAKYTTEGLVRLDAKKVDAFIENRDEEMDKSIDNTIKTLEAEKEKLKAELELKEIDLKAAEALQ